MGVMLQRHDSKRSGEIITRYGGRKELEEDQECSRRKLKLDKINFKAARWQELSRQSTLKEDKLQEISKKGNDSATETERVAGSKEVDASCDRLKDKEDSGKAPPPFKRKKSDRRIQPQAPKSLAELKIENPDDFNTSAALPVGDDNIAMTLRKAKHYDYFIILPDDKGKTYWDLIITL